MSQVCSHNCHSTYQEDPCIYASIWIMKVFSKAPHQILSRTNIFQPHKILHQLSNIRTGIILLCKLRFPKCFVLTIILCAFFISSIRPTYQSHVNLYLITFSNKGMKKQSQLTPQSRFLLEKLVLTQLVKILPIFHGTRKFTNSGPQVHILSHKFQIRTLYFYKIHLNIILPPTPKSPRWFLPFKLTE